MGSNETQVPHHETPTLGNPDLPQEGMQTTAGDPAGAKMTGPQNPVLESQFPNQIKAPATDVSTQPFFWSSFNISPRRQQAGGWAREVTQADFAISDEISGVNMYLEPGGIRELHWHQTGEWAIMTEGKCRVTTLSREGMPSVEDVFKEDLWFFPAGLPHSLQGLGPDGAEFVIVFDDGSQSESNTLLLTDWIAHTPPDVLAKNFRVAQETFKDIPLHNLWIFPGDEPRIFQRQSDPARVTPLLGGIGQTEPNTPGYQPGKNFYLRVDDLDAAIRRALEHGGTRYVDPVSVDGYTFAMVKDPEGNAIGLIKPFDAAP